MSTQQLQPAQQTQQPVAAPKASLIVTMAAQYGMDPRAFEATIRATVMPSGATNEQMAAFLLVANTYGLNPVTKEIYAFPSAGGGVTPVVGVDGWINLAQRRPEFDNMEFEFHDDDQGRPVSCTCRLYRQDRTRPMVVTEYMSECARQTAPWKSHPRRMLRHKAAIQAIRYAFGFSGIKDEDDAEVIGGATLLSSHALTEPSQGIAALAEKARSLPRPAAQAQAEPADAQPEPSGQEPVGPDNPADFEWPKANANGELVDKRGVPWLEGFHSIGKTCNQDGTWRRAKGIQPLYVEQAEKAALKAMQVEAASEPAGQPATDEAQMDQQAVFDSAKRAAATANSQDDRDDIMDLARGLSEEQRRQIVALFPPL